LFDTMSFESIVNNILTKKHSPIFFVPSSTFYHSSCQYCTAFCGATKFNGDISRWNVANVTTLQSSKILRHLSISSLL
jgi:surface protein